MKVGEGLSAYDLDIVGGIRLAIRGTYISEFVSTMAAQRRCVCGECLAAGRARCAKPGCGGVRPRPPRGAGQPWRPWQLRQPPASGAWASAPPSNQRGQNGKGIESSKGADWEMHAAEGTSLTAGRGAGLAAFEQGARGATELARCALPRSRVEAICRAHFDYVGVSH
eukprot:2421942-Pyramimonas_sp.AAC.1